MAICCGLAIMLAVADTATTNQSAAMLPVPSAAHVTVGAATATETPTPPLPSAVVPEPYVPAPAPASTDAPPAASGATGFNPPYALMRGGVNLGTCWMELPRNLVLENVKHPAMGVGSGLLKGLFYTTSRAVLSVGDVMFLGFTGTSAYDENQFPEFVTDAQWDPYRESAAAKESAAREERHFENVEAPSADMETP
jgi:hypothetical protein